MHKPRIYQHIFNEIQNDIKAGIYEIGSKLPPERDLALQLGVSRTSVREAMIALEVNGIVEVKLGSGVYVIDDHQDAANPQTGFNTTVHPLLLPYLQEDAVITPFEILEARLLIEPHLAELAAKNRTEEQLESIKEAFLMNVRDNLEHSTEHIGDRLFHIRIAESSQNDAFAFFLSFLLSKHYTEFFSRLRSLYTPEDMPLRSQLEHQEIMTAIQNQDAQSAHDAMKKHLQNVIHIFEDS
ncbi:FadR/GntR family transcriptional regulator [Psychrobacter sp. JCM 18900]|uniref:FadR/GntR family transcriptional regulator n=1 Tax=Psychrobacter sp. JCM 18900 TaxID=1298608 RepID=UPI0004311A19|nr:FadR/GntR family transcriptional regulator [Psychrobacter sp. JCM 18900]GAF53538.1 transcriptional regulator, GntR family [Psychrobacter sp. JCM 18900]